MVARGGCTLATGPRSGLERLHWSPVARGGNCVATSLRMPGGFLNSPETCQNLEGLASQCSFLPKGLKAWGLLFEESPPTAKVGLPAATPSKAWQNWGPSCTPLPVLLDPFSQTGGFDC